MLRILLLALLFIALYRFITRFVFPLLRITSAVRGQMRQMQQQDYAQHQQSPPKAKASSGDYIDFEEVK
jgi:hypothetical protein